MCAHERHIRVARLLSFFLVCKWVDFFFFFLILILKQKLKQKKKENNVLGVGGFFIVCSVPASAGVPVSRLHFYLLFYEKDFLLYSVHMTRRTDSFFIISCFMLCLRSLHYDSTVCIFYFFFFCTVGGFKTVKSRSV